MADLSNKFSKLTMISALLAGIAVPGFAQEPPQPRPDGLTEEAAKAKPEEVKADETPKAPLTEGLAGPFLAARMATVENDFRAAAKYFSQAVAQDPNDQYLQDGALLSLLSAGEMERASELTEQIGEQGGGTELSYLVERIKLARSGEWAALLELQKNSKASPNALLDGMIEAWALLGAGKATEALAAFEDMSKSQDFGTLAKYHLALARAMVGDYEGASSLLSDQRAEEHLLGLTARLQILAQLERRDEALKLLEQVRNIETEPQLVALRERLESGEPIAFDVIDSPADGISQLLLTFATALAEAADPEPLSLIHARLATWLTPDSGDAHLLVAQLLQQRQQFDLAEAEFEALRTMGEMRPVAELSRIDALARADRLDEAERAALSLTAAYPNLPQAWIASGDLMRQQEKFSQAVPAYDKALTLLKDGPTEIRWFPLYARGIALERSGKFDRAEKDLLAAIEIRPDEPSLLNYLGYSWIDRNENLERGLDLIRKAVKLSPDDAYILDSLAWAYFRLGRYEEAVAPMEKAIGSMASDPLVNDHLGDIYWMVGRHREAEVQWQRALSLKPGESGDVDPDRIRAKLEKGLNKVLAEEEASGESEQLPQPLAEAGAASQPAE